MNKSFGLKALSTALVLALGLTGCGEDEKKAEKPSYINNPYPSTYVAKEADSVLIKNVHVLTGTGEYIERTHVLLEDGKIKAIGRNAGKADVTVDADGKWLSPGIIDVHSHMGNYSSPGVWATSDGNEMTAPNTAEVWTEHSVHPQDPNFRHALAAGVTTVQILPGSANLFGGRAVTLKTIPSRTIQGMKFPDAPYGLKMACGENPKRVYGSKGRAPGTRMGNMAGFRNAWIQAAEYKAKIDAGETPTRNLELETLAGVLAGEILIHNHCYTAEEMALMIDLSKEFDYQVTAFHHGVESYKIADLLAENNICGALWADWWGFKLEAYDFTEANIALMEKAGACAIVHSDSEIDVQRLNQEAAKAMLAGRQHGIDIDDATAMTWLTKNAAKAIGIDDVTGTIEEGKNADVVIWSHNPFSVYAKADKVYIDGSLYFDREDTAVQSRSDFELGQPALEAK